MMTKKTAVFLFMGICVVLAILLLSGSISGLLSGGIFAVALLIFGVLSRGFRKETQ
jgi:hypothetical protein